MNYVATKAAELGVTEDDRFWEPLFGDDYAIHAAERGRGGSVVVLWSDAKGYTVSHKGVLGQGTSGVFESVTDAARQMDAVLDIV